MINRKKNTFQTLEIVIPSLQDTLLYQDINFSLYIDIVITLLIRIYFTQNKQVPCSITNSISALAIE